MPTIKDDLGDANPINHAKEHRCADGVHANGASPQHESRITEQLSRRIGPHKFDMWFGQTQLSVRDGGLQIKTDSPFVARWIDDNFAADLRDVARETLGESARVDVSVDASSDSTDNGAPDALPSKTKGRGRRSPVAAPNDGQNGHHDRAARSAHGSDSTPSPHHSPARKPALRKLENFVVGSSNRLAWSEACRFATEQDVLGHSPLFIHGECGLGKTHLLQGICQRWMDTTGKSTGVRYVTAEDFTNDFIFSLKSGKLEQFRVRTRKLDLLAIDDVHFLADKVRTQSEFLYTLDAIGLSGSRIVMASDAHPRHIKKFNQALVSRCLSGMVVKIERPDRELRLELIRRLAAVRGLTINAAAADNIAGQCVGSVREIEGAVAKLAAFSQLVDGQGIEGSGDQGIKGDKDSADPQHSMPGCLDASIPRSREIGVVLTNQLFNEQAWHPAAPIRLSAVIETVCTRLNVVRSDLIGSGRHKRVVLARALVAYLSREMTTHSFPEIAQALGRTFHSTIHTADQRLRKQLAANETTDAIGGAQTTSLKELADQLRYQIARGAN